jgi:uroporphyrinogen III methyltransferase/synthase
MKGKVYIVGAGPGDIDLLTIKGLKCLQKAEVVVYDFHLNAQVLNYVNHEAEFIYAGKRGGHHTMTQDEINQILIEKAKQGRNICRLKGGDPFVFGRGGEEAEALSKEGIEFEVVPGVSSAVAAPAYAGIPLTHRRYSSSFAIVSGYEDATKKESSIDWSKLATGVGTIVFLMSIKNIEEICRKLIENGRSPETPVAVIRWGTRSDQKTIVNKLKNISKSIKEKEIKPPAVMVVGDVVNLRKKLKWYEKKPLFGQRVLVTREHSGDFELLAELGAEIIEFPTIKIVPPISWVALDEAIDKIESYNWLILTSINSVKFFFKRLFERDKDIRELKGVKICAIGTKTAGEVKKYGLKINLVPEEFNAEGLIKAFIAEYETQTKTKWSTEQGLKGIKFLLPRAEHGRSIFPDAIKELGGEIDVATVYRAVNPGVHGKRLKRFLKERKISIVTFTSAATFNNFISIMDKDAHNLLKGVIIAVIGPVTAKAVKTAGFKVNIMPRQATIEGMVREIICWVANKPFKCH